MFSVSDASSRSSVARVGVDHHVLEDRAEPAGGRVDLRLGLGRQLDHLGVAAALEVEDARVAPAVLVVADEAPLRVARERGLAGAGEAEEQRRVALGADVRRAVHRQHALARQHVVEDREDRLLDFAGVVGAADQHQLLAEVHEDEDVGPRAVLGRIGLEERRVDDRELGAMLGPLCRVVLGQEHVAGEQVVPGKLVDDADRQLVDRIGAGPRIQHEELLVLQVGHHVAVERRRTFPRRSGG